VDETPFSHGLLPKCIRNFSTDIFMTWLYEFLWTPPIFSSDPIKKKAPLSLLTFVILHRLALCAVPSCRLLSAIFVRKGLPEIHQCCFLLINLGLVCTPQLRFLKKRVPWNPLNPLGSAIGDTVLVFCMHTIYECNLLGEYQLPTATSTRTHYGNTQESKSICI